MRVPAQAATAFVACCLFALSGCSGASVDESPEALGESGVISDALAASCHDSTYVVRMAADVSACPVTCTGETTTNCDGFALRPANASSRARWDYVPAADIRDLGFTATEASSFLDGTRAGRMIVIGSIVIGSRDQVVIGSRDASSIVIGSRDESGIVIGSRSIVIGSRVFRLSRALSAPSSTDLGRPLYTAYQTSYGYRVALINGRTASTVSSVTGTTPKLTSELNERFAYGESLVVSRSTAYRGFVATGIFGELEGSCWYGQEACAGY